MVLKAIAYLPISTIRLYLYMRIVIVGLQEHFSKVCPKICLTLCGNALIDVLLEARLHILMSASAECSVKPPGQRIRTPRGASEDSRQQSSLSDLPSSYFRPSFSACTAKLCHCMCWYLSKPNCVNEWCWFARNATLLGVNVREKAAGRRSVAHSDKAARQRTSA